MDRFIVTVFLLFDLNSSLYFFNIRCLIIYGTHMTANNSTNNKVVLLFVSDFKIVYYNNY